MFLSVWKHNHCHNLHLFKEVPASALLITTTTIKYSLRLHRCLQLYRLKLPSLRAICLIVKAFFCPGIFCSRCSAFTAIERRGLEWYISCSFRKSECYGEKDPTDNRSEVFVLVLLTVWFCWVSDRLNTWPYHKDIHFNLTPFSSPPPLRHHRHHRLCSSYILLTIAWTVFFFLFLNFVTEMALDPSFPWDIVNSRHREHVKENTYVITYHSFRPWLSRSD